jgi:hypothetical protein
LTDNAATEKPERQERGKGGTRVDPPGYDAGTKIKGKKRHVPVDTQGLLMQAIIHAADIQDRDGGMLPMGSLLGLDPFLLKLYADSGCQAPSSRTGCAPPAASQPGYREAVRPAQVRRAAEALDRRAHHRMAQSVPTIGQGLGMPEPLRAQLPALGLSPPHAAKAMSGRQMIPDGLLEAAFAITAG